MTNNRILEAFYRQHLPEMLGFVYKYCDNQDSCEDVIQEVFLDLLVKKKLDHISDMKSYIFTALKYRSFKKGTSATISWDDHYMAHNGFYVSPLPDHFWFCKNRLNFLKKLITSMPFQKKKVIYLYYYKNCSYKEIAHRIGLSYKAVDNQLTQIKRNLRNSVAIARLKHLEI